MSVCIFASVFSLLTVCSTWFVYVSEPSSLYQFCGTCRSTQNFSSIAWALYAPDGELVSLQGICLGRTTNNIFEYSAVIKLLSKVIALGIRALVVKIDS